MNDERTDDRRTDAPQPSAVPLAHPVRVGVETSRVHSDPPSTTAFDIAHEGPCFDCATTSPKLRGGARPCCPSTRFLNARMYSTSCPTAASCRAFCVRDSPFI